MSLEIATIVVSDFSQNCRILIDRSTSSACVVDPGSDVQLITDEIQARKVTIESIFLTHSHIDHAGGVKDLQIALRTIQGQQAKLYAHPNERDFRATIESLVPVYGLDPAQYKNCPEPDHELSGGEEFRVGSLSALVIYTPGHSPGHLALYFKSHQILIAGDTVFSGSVGRVDLPGGNEQVLKSSILDKILKLPGETKLLSGHGPNTTVAAELGKNPFVKIWQAGATL
ncbi:MBL fold metallo-hydrolase [bacterium]|nr:MBL fold metallo-hydrolase [bacterium]